MHAGRIVGATRLLGAAQGYDELPVRDSVVIGSGISYPVMTSAWLPDLEDLTRLNRGGSIFVTLVGQEHPPIRVTVGDVPDKYPIRLNTEADLMRCGLCANEARVMASRLMAQGLRLAPLVWT